MEKKLFFSPIRVKKNAVLIAVWIFVIIAHTVILYYLISETAERAKKKAGPVKMTVTTVKLQEKTRNTSIGAVHPREEKKNIAAVPKKDPVIPPPVVKPKTPTPTIKKEEKKKEPQDDKKSRLLKQAKESIALVNAKPYKSSDTKKISPLSEKSLPAEIGELESNSSEYDYKSRLAGTLKALLQLPEYGDVQIKLCLNRAGKVTELIVLKTDSKLNKKYVEEHLPKLTLLSFGNNFLNSSSKTFTITLTNE